MKATMDIPDTTVNWAQDPDAWQAHGGMTVVQRMDRLKAVLKEAQAALSVGEGESANNSHSPDEVMEKAVLAMQDAVPEDLRPKLPWSAMINLINAGLGKVGWCFLGRRGGGPSSSSSHSAEEYAAAAGAAMDGVSRWLPDTAINHEAAPTVSADKEAAPEFSLAVYQEMWPVEYPQEPILRVIGEDFPRRPYKARAEDKSRGRRQRDVHWGQRKLFMNEIELLTLYGKAGDVVVYAGAAPGTHLCYLVQTLFPDIKFVLVDPAPFTIRQSDRVDLRQELMTDALAKEFSGRDNVIFVSDIRRTYASEDLIKEDMSDQQRWHDIIRPKVSMLKFRLPWLPGETEYLCGKVYTQPYAKPRSTEMRLIVDGYDKRMWSNQAYEEQCFFFNTIVREAHHHHEVDGAGLDNTWDCAAEVEILREYLKARREGFADLEREEQNKEVALLSIRITVEIGGEQSKQWRERMDPRLLSEVRRSSSSGDASSRRDSRSEEDEQERKWVKSESPSKARYRREQDDRQQGRREEHRGRGEERDSRRRRSSHDDDRGREKRHKEEEDEKMRKEISESR